MLELLAPSQATIFARRLVFGRHFASASEGLLVDLGCQFTHANEWFGSPYSLEHRRDRSKSLLVFMPRELEWYFSTRYRKLQKRSCLVQVLPLQSETSRCLLLGKDRWCAKRNNLWRRARK